MLMAILQENGRKINPPLLQKMVRDDVCWDKADKPWRRLPFWLVLRVSVARFLAEAVGGPAGRVEYKFLIANLLASFLTDARGSDISVPQLHLLKTKLCRRLVKLDADKELAQDSLVAARIDNLLEQLRPTLSNSIHKTTAYIEAEWSQQKSSMLKGIPPLPRQAHPDDLRLELRGSGVYLNNVLSGFSRPRPVRNLDGVFQITAEEAAKQHMNLFSFSHFSLVDLEATCEDFCNDRAPSSPEETCATASKLISNYLKRAMPLYDGNAEQNSLMILTVMELWVELDKAACTAYPLIRDYNTLFHPDLLDPLLIPQFKDMKRVQKIQAYLRERLNNCDHSSANLFDDPGRGCFAHRWYEESPDSTAMSALHDSIESQAENMRLCKQNEWKKKTAEYNDLSRQIDQSSCIYRVDDDNPLGRGRHDPRCDRCKMMARQSGMRIEAYEHPLPSDAVTARVVIFELMCPPTFAKYRQTTWQVLSRLALQWSEPSPPPKCFVREYQQLAAFANLTQSTFALASTTKSCEFPAVEPFTLTNHSTVLTTHYSWMHFPVEWDSGRDSVCRPNGLRVGYFDATSSCWPGRRRCRPTFLHHVRLQIPRTSPFHKLLQNEAFAEFTYGPSSYDVMSAVSNCPAGLNVHEYLAFQTVASGKARRWLAILTELGSSNLNFSNEATTTLLNHLALQCGPPGENSDPFRLSHSIFRDEMFCTKLADQLLQRLESLSANWRETHLLDTIITFALRLADFSSTVRLSRVSEKALAVLIQAREICVRWFILLRTETYKSIDSATSKSCQQYALWAALLCKRTFAVRLSQPDLLDTSSLEMYIQGSITAQDNLVFKVEELPQLLHYAVIRDLRLSYRLRELVLNSIMQNPSALSSSLKELWPETEGFPRKLSKVVPETNGWISCVAKSCEEAAAQNVLYNVAEGILLIDGRPIGVSYE